MLNNKAKERRKMSLKYEGRFFMFGAIFGSLLIIFWNYFLNHDTSFYNLKEEMSIEQMKSDTNHMLLNYIEGRWISSVSDLIVVIDIDDKKDFLVLETTRGSKSVFKIHDIEKVNGVLGIVRLDLCELTKDCVSENIIPIQLNKVFGVDRAITITYDTRLAYCAEPEDKCVRGFKRHEE